YYYPYPYQNVNWYNFPYVLSSVAGSGFVELVVVAVVAQVFDSVGLVVVVVVAQAGDYVGLVVVGVVV
ncbi:unnamed protein product, partial [Rotaria sp. Silwood1]